MTQDELWYHKYQEVVDFIGINHRNPSKHRIEEHLMLNFIKHKRKLLNAGKRKAERVVKFNELMALGFAKTIFIDLRQGSTRILITSSPSGNRYLTKRSMMNW